MTQRIDELTGMLLPTDYGPQYAVTLKVTGRMQQVTHMMDLACAQQRMIDIVHLLRSNGYQFSNSNKKDKEVYTKLLTSGKFKVATVTLKPIVLKSFLSELSI